MGGATIWPVPKAIDLEAYHYPRHWKRNMFFLYGGLFIIGFQISRYALLCKVSLLLSILKFSLSFIPQLDLNLSFCVAINY